LSGSHIQATGFAGGHDFYPITFPPDPALPLPHRSLSCSA
jgi:hypothetical protein